jgi:TetR/AcrR family transcriptional regulator, cholesterol catabolism regulator
MAKSALSTPELTPPVVAPAELAEAPTPGLRERNKRDKLRRIAAAARELFEQKGFEATTAREVCKRAQIGTGTLFLYVRDKHQLLILAFRDDSERLLEGGPRVLSSKGVVDSWMTFFGRFIDFYGERPELARLFIRELSFRPDHEFAEAAALTKKLRDRVEDLARQAQEVGELRADVPLAEITNAVLSHWAFWVHLWLGAEGVRQRNVKKHLRRALELLFDGLRQR